MTPTRPTTLYNPHLLRKDELLAGFIARRPLLDALVDDLRRGGGQHHLLVGARGTGKTTLLLRLAFAIDDDPALAGRAIALRFPEEQYNLARLSDFWLNCLDALVDALERRGAAAEARALDAVIAELDDLTDDDERATQALAHLTGYTRDHGQLAVLLLDNLDLIFDRLAADQWALRKVLSGETGLVVIGASSAAVPETFEYGQAFYDFFNVHELAGLDDDEARRVLRHLAESLGTPAVVRALDEQPGRLRALLLLSGGTPRTLQLLHGVLADGASASAERDLERMLDQVTPYYKARFEDLPTQAQQIFDAVALHWHPMTASECADKLRLDVTLVSAQLTRLTRQGVIAKVPHASGKLGFQIAERFFGLWYMMRASRRLRRKLLWLARSVQELYGQDEVARRADALLALTEGALAAEDPSKLLAFAAVADDVGMRRRLERRAVAMMMQAGEPGVAWRGLELDGEDRDLKEQVDRVAELKRIHETIERHIEPPEGLTARECADAIVGSPEASLSWKTFVANKIAKGGDWSRITPPPHDVWPEPLTRAVRHGEVFAFNDASTEADVDDLLRLVPAEKRADALGSIAGSRHPRAASCALQALEPFNVARALEFTLINSEDNWLATRERLEQCLTRFDRDNWPWQAPLLWGWTVFFGHAREAAALLRDLGLDDRAQPLYEALRAHADGVTGELHHLAPELRAPTEGYRMVFKIFTAPAAHAPTTSPSPAPPSPSPPTSGRGRSARPGTRGARRRRSRRPAARRHR
jgi:hypothetical protein